MTNLELMRRRLEYQGGNQSGRMIKDKYRTFLKTLKYSYQAANVELIEKRGEPVDAPPNPRFRALINPDKTKQDYDDKILSIDYNSNFEPGDVFKWVHDDRLVVDGRELPALETYWIIYLENLTEDAYFRGEIRQCEYKINFKDADGNWCSTWAAIRGPVETQINSIQKNQIRVDTPNLSLNILMPRNEKTLFAFDRYKEFLFAGKCWRVEAPDSISMKNIIEVNAEEYYIDRDTDDIENEMKDGLVIEPVEVETGIKGKGFIKPQTETIYSTECQGGIWCVKEKEADVTITPVSNKSVKVVWNKMTSGQFILQWHKGHHWERKVIVVESLF